MNVTAQTLVTDQGSTERDYLIEGLAKLADATPVRIKRQDAYEGRHDLPFAPEGSSTEYMALRQMAPLPLIRLAVRTACQRLRAGGVRTSKGQEFDRDLWRIWDRNNLGSRQRIPYTDGLVHDCGIMSVWPNKADKTTPIIRPESPASVHVESDPADPFRSIWAVKTWVERRNKKEITVAMLYLPKEVIRYEGEGSQQLAEVPDSRTTNPLGRVPFVTFVPEIDAVGNGVSLVDALMPAQRSIDTMRFNLLLAAQFAAFRQRVTTGYDPVLRDGNGDPIVKRGEDGEPILDADGQEQPIVRSPGRVGVDRLLAFPGELTKVFDLEESDLKNYVAALDMLVATFAAIAQVPPQYLIGDFKNVSGDLMVATEATLRSLITDLQTGYGESIKEVTRLVEIARGGDANELSDLEVDWSDADPKNINQLASAAAQMVPNGAPLKMFLEQWPGATPRTVERWMKDASEAMARIVAGDYAAIEMGPKPDAQ
ncbi:phage portal protein [Rhodococcus erythropolis]|uniref:phage portal protein n=1 Tax=Rhodococcus erythropolis TaxID=1833 RepID=UPI001F1C2DAC|nr:phage portal protein [Rhodococcus erythropolis]UJC77951.1 phage portal protein [Rhodococcus erythropolis]